MNNGYFQFSCFWGTSFISLGTMFFTKTSGGAWISSVTNGEDYSEEISTGCYSTTTNSCHIAIAYTSLDGLSWKRCDIKSTEASTLTAYKQLLETNDTYAYLDTLLPIGNIPTIIGPIFHFKNVFVCTRTQKSETGPVRIVNTQTKVITNIHASYSVDNGITWELSLHSECFYVVAHSDTMIVAICDDIDDALNNDYIKVMYSLDGMKWYNSDLRFYKKQSSDSFIMLFE
jgi:hypothetical protein